VGTSHAGEQRRQRLQADPAAGLGQPGRGRRVTSGVAAVDQFPPHPAVAHAIEQRQRQHEQYRHPGWQPAQPSLHPAGGDQNLIDEGGRDILGEHPETDPLPHRTGRRVSVARTRTPCGKI
jgi:hypothetical protein